MGVNVFGRIFDRFHEVVLGRSELPHQGADVVVGTGVRRPQSQGFTVVCDSLFGLGRVSQKVAEIVMHLGVVGQGA